ncbi:ABC transporter permease [Paenibacillus sacheonensis]|uniref:ABC transporter permease subunit n=1 Tax=Paenibacillus sacheonensis TaxID=742054 RepID=A0A7X5C387_9BACL|nr:ABC transporter permease [Paenibacillus sacheonensis]MBM7568437.1 peptide/nickel transport system permease protein [Paenibacillus sacheonensis]NBC72135.1 ABC transporter permease subunit [Paenibacillus sacheonensis]
MNRSKWRNVGAELMANKAGIVAILVLVVFALAAAFAFLSSKDPNEMNVMEKLRHPGAAHWFGTDDYGRDYFARALYGGRVSLTVGFLAMILSTGIGVTIGVISGYFGGLIDSLLMRFVEIIMSIPSFLILLLLSIYLKPSIGNLIVIISLLMWMNISRIVRAETMSLKEREYVLYAKASGQSSFGIIGRHILPNLVSVIIVSATNNVASAIMMESSLSFLGFGVQAPNATWGSMLNGAQGLMFSSPYLAIFPGLLIFLTVLSFNVLGDILRVGFEPKLGKR